MCEVLYLQDMDLLTCSGTITQVDEDKRCVALDRTPFYPQGGGQQSDRGELIAPSWRVAVTAVKKAADGVPWHHIEGEDLNGDWWRSAVGTSVTCHVNAPARTLNSRSHSAGHLLDHAAEELKLPVTVKHAFHFLPCPYVEYEVVDESMSLDKEALERLVRQMEDKANEIVARGVAVTVYDGRVEELSEWRQALIPAAVRESGTVRLIKFDGFEPVPCSGTHVKNSAHIRPIKVKKIGLPHKDQRVIRVVYLLSAEA